MILMTTTTHQWLNNHQSWRNLNFDITFKIRQQQFLKNNQKQLLPHSAMFHWLYRETHYNNEDCHSNDQIANSNLNTTHIFDWGKQWLQNTKSKWVHFTQNTFKEKILSQGMFPWWSSCSIQLSIFSFLFCLQCEEICVKLVQKHTQKRSSKWRTTRKWQHSEMCDFWWRFGNGLCRPFWFWRWLIWSWYMENWWWIQIWIHLGIHGGNQNVLQ